VFRRDRELTLKGFNRFLKTVEPAERYAMTIMKAGMIGSALDRLLKFAQRLFPPVRMRMLRALRMMFASSADLDGGRRNKFRKSRFCPPPIGSLRNERRCTPNHLHYSSGKLCAEGINQTYSVSQGKYPLVLKFICFAKRTLKASTPVYGIISWHPMRDLWIIY